MDLILRDALSVLSKASPFSVKTITGKPRDKLDDAKEWLYVEQDIERDFRKGMAGLLNRPGMITFLCGSSGDGKSEILARCEQRYRGRFRFHLDGTHSFSPHETAIEALNNLFDQCKVDGKPLVVGINVGMLANYSKEGAEQHADIRESIERFLAGGDSGPNHHFFDFENYPKFTFNINAKSSHSAFAKSLMQRLTAPSPDNPFHALSKQDEEEGREALLHANFNLLALDVVQDAIIANLFKARLFKDQFITARALLDFIHHLLLGNGHLADNLFGGSDNELVQRMNDFDPTLLHTRALDEFVLRYKLELPNRELTDFIEHLRANRLISDPAEGSSYEAVTLIRLFYLLRHFSIGNDFHHRFRQDFREESLEEFSQVWSLHAAYDGSNESKGVLRKFYSNELISAVYRYANRNAPWLERGSVFLGKFGTTQLAARIDVKADLNAIQENVSKTVFRFLACLKVADRTLPPIPVNLNLFELIFKLNRGYRPNKYDKNAVVLLDELVEQVREVAKHSDNLIFYENEHRYTAHLDDGLIEINGIS
jgi:DNA phosphorothioation-dependent restriction protein DptF